MLFTGSLSGWRFLTLASAPANLFVAGATTVGLKCSGGVVLASEKRVSYGFTVMSKAGKKVFPVTKYLGVAFAGLVSDMQAVVRRLAAEANLYELEHGKLMPVKAAAKLLANILYAQRLYPILAETLVGGLSEGSPQLFVLDPLGSIIEDKYAALGTGAPIAIGILETNYRDDLSVEEAEALAVKAIRAAIERDAASGDGIDVLIITDQGVFEKSYPARPA